MNTFASADGLFLYLMRTSRQLMIYVFTSNILICTKKFVQVEKESIRSHAESLRQKVKRDIQNFIKFVI